MSPTTRSSVSDGGEPPIQIKGSLKPSNSVSKKKCVSFQVPEGGGVRRPLTTRMGKAIRVNPATTQGYRSIRVKPATTSGYQSPITRSHIKLCDVPENESQSELSYGNECTASKEVLFVDKKRKGSVDSSLAGDQVEGPDSTDSGVKKRNVQGSLTLAQDHQAVRCRKVTTLPLHRNPRSISSRSSTEGAVSKNSVSSSIFPSARTRMSLNGLVYVIRCVKNLEQWMALHEIGFGGLFSLGVRVLPMQLGYWLLEHFNAAKTALVLPDGQELRLTDLDVHATLGLPMGPKAVEIASSVNDSKDFSAFYKQWRDQFGVESGLISNKTLQHYLANQLHNDDIGDFFKINFVVLVVSLMIRNNQKSFANFHILKSLMNASEIKNYNWCDFILTNLRECTLKWKQKKTHYEGPLLFLMLVYVDRVVHGSRTVDRYFPTQFGWTTTLLKAREKQEMVYGKFGDGVIADRMTEVVHTTPANALPESSASGAVACGNEPVPNSSPFTYSSPEEYVQDYAASAKKMAEDMVALDEKILAGEQQFPNDPKVKKLHSSTGLLYRMYGHCDEEQAVDTWFKEESFDDALISTLLSIEKAYDKKINVLASNQRFLKRPRFSPDFSPPTFDLLGFAQENTGEPSHEKHDAWEVGEDEIDDQTVIKKLLSDRNDEKHVLDGCSTRTNAEHHVNPVNVVQEEKGCQNYIMTRQRGRTTPPVVLEDSAVDVDAVVHNVVSDISASSDKNDTDSVNEKECKSTTQYTVTQRLGKKTIPGLVPRFVNRDILRKDTDPLLEPNELQQKIVDYVFFDDMSVPPKNAELYFQYKQVSGFRTTFQTLKPESQVSNFLVDCWSTWLNANERMKADGAPRRFFFTTLVFTLLENNEKNSDKVAYETFRNSVEGEMGYYEWIDVKEVDMFFFPAVYNKHFILYVFDLRAKKYSILDNWLHTMKLDDAYGILPIKLMDCLGMFLGDKEETRAKGTAVMDMTPEIVKMSWRNSVNVTDCGIYLMRHMETFMGNRKWSCGLRKNDMDALRVLRIKYLCVMLSFEHNRHFKRILAKAQEHAMKVKLDKLLESN